MKRVMLAIACVLIPSLAGAAAPDSTSAPAGRANSLRSGVWALQFDINGDLLSVDEFSGGVSLKRHFSAKSAVRLGIGLDGYTSSEEAENSLGDINDVDRDAYEVYLEMLLQRYVNPGAPVNFYWGVGPYVSFFHTNSDNVTETQSSSSETDRLGVGARAMIGVEWFAAREISLHAEYTVVGGYFNAESTQSVSGPGSSSSSKDESDGWSFNTDGVRLGLSIYF